MTTITANPTHCGHPAMEPRRVNPSFRTASTMLPRSVTGSEEWESARCETTSLAA
jgi:hypothetical protein